MSRDIGVGDRVRPTDSSVIMSGSSSLRDSNYVIVQWPGSMRGTHHRSSLEYLNETPRRTPV